MTQQEMLIPSPIDKKEAIAIAYSLIREKYGNLPSIGKIEFDKPTISWLVAINVKYPRISFDQIQEVPKKVRFMNFENLGIIKINANTGVVIDKPSYFSFRNEVQERLEIVFTSVQKALVKIGAQKFSQLPFSEHMHSPIEDILSNLFLKDKLSIEKDLGMLNQQDFEKYLKNIDILTKMGLIRRNGDLILPDNALIEIDQSENDISKKLTNALAFFFSNGYDDIKSIQQVLGPHLAISGYIYEKSFEYDGIMEINYREILTNIARYYSDPSKSLKLPRYLIQLVRVGLIDQKVIKGETFWYPENQIFQSLIQQEMILEPAKQVLMASTVLT